MLVTLGLVILMVLVALIFLACVGRILQRLPEPSAPAPGVAYPVPQDAWLIDPESGSLINTANMRGVSIVVNPPPPETPACFDVIGLWITLPDLKSDPQFRIARCASLAEAEAMLRLLQWRFGAIDLRTATV